MDDALLEGSLPLLEAALLCIHRCGCSHSILEAVRCRHLEAVRFLLKSKVANFDDHCFGHRALHLAIQACTTEGDVGYQMAKLLLEHGARPNPCAGDNATAASPLHDAAKRGIVAAVKLLLAYGASSTWSDANGFTPLHVVCQSSSAHITISEMALSESGFCVQNKLQSLGGGAFMQVVEFLLRYEACALQVDKVGLAPDEYVDDGHLRQKLLRAKRCWGRRALLLARGRLGIQSKYVYNDGGPCWFLPEVFELIASCL